MMLPAQFIFNLKYPKPSELFTPGTHNFRIYERLLIAPLTNEQISDKDDLHILAYSRRITDIREALEPFLFGIKTERVNKGLFKYSLI